MQKWAISIRLWINGNLQISNFISNPYWIYMLWQVTQSTQNTHELMQNPIKINIWHVGKYDCKNIWSVGVWYNYKIRISITFPFFQTLEIYKTKYLPFSLYIYSEFVCVCVCFSSLTYATVKLKQGTIEVSNMLFLGI